MNLAAFGILHEGQAERLSQKVCEWTQNDIERELTRVRYELQLSKNRERQLRRRNAALNDSLDKISQTLASEYGAKIKDLENANRRLKEELGREKGKVTKAQRGRDAARQANKTAAHEIDQLCREIVKLRAKVANLECGL